MGRQSQLDSTGDLAAKTADVNGIWQELIAPGQVRHSGNIHLTVKSPFPGRPQVAAQITTRGHVPTGSWDGEVNLQGAGRNWSEMDWLINLPRLNWSAKMPLAIAELSARV